MTLPRWLNTAWMWACRREAHAFRRATANVAETQAAVLREIVEHSCFSKFGRTHGFDSIRNVDEFRTRVPIRTYNEYADSIQRIAGGERDVLTTEPVLLLEPTSGTSGGEKLIPYTPMLRRQFQRAVSAWIADLMQHRPSVKKGRAYWSISPAMGRERRTEDGIPIGFDDDTAYLGRLERVLVNRLMAIPAAIAKLPDIENFRYCTLLHLLRADDLALMSIWSPTFLTTLLRPLDQWSEQICSDLQKGTLTLPNPAGTAVPESLVPSKRSDARRAAELRAIFASDGDWDAVTKRIWPRLTMISCWADAAAATYLPELRQLFPSVEIQPKGLLATEGFVSFPLVGRPGGVLALRSHFFEFQELDDSLARDVPLSQWISLAHELESGRRYQVILTTGGGLYRYRLGDTVEVVGFEESCPLVRFVGRSDSVSDLVGEKLSDLHVREILERVFAAHEICPSFAMVVPVPDRTPHYRLYLQVVNTDLSARLAKSVESDVEEGLRQNPYYRHAVALGQLAPLDVQVLDDSSEAPWAIYERRCMAKGQQLGDVKPTALGTTAIWTGKHQGSDESRSDRRNCDA